MGGRAKGGEGREAAWRWKEGREGGSTHICCRPRKNGNSASATVKCNCHIGRGQEEDGGGAGTGRSSKMPQQDGAAAADPRTLVCLLSGYLDIFDFGFSLMKILVLSTVQLVLTS